MIENGTKLKFLLVNYYFSFTLNWLKCSEWWMEYVWTGFMCKIFKHDLFFMPEALINNDRALDLMNPMRKESKTGDVCIFDQECKPHLPVYMLLREIYSNTLGYYSWQWMDLCHFQAPPGVCEHSLEVGTQPTTCRHPMILNKYIEKRNKVFLLIQSFKSNLKNWRCMVQLLRKEFSI